MEDDDVIVAANAALIAANVGAVATISTVSRNKRKHATWVKKYICDRLKF